MELPFLMIALFLLLKFLHFDLFLFEFISSWVLLSSVFTQFLDFSQHFLSFLPSAADALRFLLTHRYLFADSFVITPQFLRPMLSQHSISLQFLKQSLIYGFLFRNYSLAISLVVDSEFLDLLLESNDLLDRLINLLVEVLFGVVV